ncbi:hypothetical protein CAPTEDRAFT_200339 [Capitella teleta]|uniref:Uncharacterized protein n=1 Tax=Capitella teleta TaxID=283909 RepID=R7UTF5_CAPTE|nr:hypothetical protein CAPTEDRAFT_200339 [Capitella teleta]|eukprot:ELU09470.1 hypothetical protein CAPTEDRAFT_200339 [Capitella teleta]
MALRGQDEIYKEWANTHAQLTVNNRIQIIQSNVVHRPHRGCSHFAFNVHCRYIMTKSSACELTTFSVHYAQPYSNQGGLPENPSEAISKECGRASNVRCLCCFVPADCDRVADKALGDIRSLQGECFLLPSILKREQCHLTLTAAVFISAFFPAKSAKFELCHRKKLKGAKERFAFRKATKAICVPLRVEEYSCPV